jgi:hypothetical protein
MSKYDKLIDAIPRPSHVWWPSGLCVEGCEGCKAKYAIEKLKKALDAAEKKEESDDTATRH